MIMTETIQRICSLYNGKVSSIEVAKQIGVSSRYVRKIATRFDLSRLHCGGQPGKNNHQFVSGRRIDPDGYVLITAPNDHPFARQRTSRDGKLIFEHRIVLEKTLGRYLEETEVVDHIDGLTLHNDPSNLRLFPKNGDHLRETITGLKKEISVSGRQNILTRNDPPSDWTPVDTYGLRRKRGDVRLRQILLAALLFGIDSPYLLGTHYHLKKVHIDYSSHSNLELALAQLLKRWEEDLAR
jgi:hypothetical protein